MTPATVFPLEQREVVLRTQAMEVRCPKCGAGVWQYCQGRKGARKSCHIERHQLRIQLSEGVEMGGAR